MHQQEAPVVHAVGQNDPFVRGINQQPAFALQHVRGKRRVNAQMSSAAGCQCGARPAAQHPGFDGRVSKSTLLAKQTRHRQQDVVTLKHVPDPPKQLHLDLGSLERVEDGVAQPVLHRGVRQLEPSRPHGHRLARVNQREVRHRIGDQGGPGPARSASRGRCSRCRSWPRVVPAGARHAAGQTAAQAFDRLPECPQLRGRFGRDDNCRASRHARRVPIPRETAAFSGEMPVSPQNSPKGGHA